MGRPHAKNPKKTLISYRLDASMADELSAHIARRYKESRLPPSLSEMARIALDEWLADHRASAPADAAKKGRGR